MPSKSKAGKGAGYKSKGRVKNGPPKDKRLSQNKMKK